MNSGADAGTPWNDRRHFVGIAARSMRQILVERARARGAQKRWGALNRVSITDSLALASDPNLPKMQETALRTMARVLGFKSIACQESALHGLGHWQRDHERQVNAIIDGFLKANRDIDSRLISYAHSARCGCVL